MPRIDPVARINVRDIEDSVKDRLRVRAARNGRSLEEEVRTILRSSVRGMNGPEFVEFMTREFGPENGVDIELPPRSSHRRIPTFD